MFYTKMLREQDELMGNTGFDPDMVVNSDDKYAIDLKDIAQAVEDINDEYAEESEQEELDGQDLHEDPVAEAMIAVYESEHNWNVIMQAIGTHELMESARGREMLMTEAETAGFIDKVKEFFVTQFKKISDAVKKFIEDTLSMSHTCAAFYKKYGKKFDEGRAAYEKSDRAALKGYNYKTDKIHNTIFKGADAIMKMVHSEVAMSKFEDYKNMATSLDGVYSALGVSEGKDMRKTLKADFCGEKGTLTAETLNNVSKAITEGPAHIKEVRAMYAEIKKNFNAIIKFLNKMKGEVDKSEKKSDAMTGLTKYIADVKKANNAMHVAYAAGMSAMRGEILQAMRVAHAWVAAIGKPKKEKKEPVKTESAGFFGSLELL